MHLGEVLFFEEAAPQLGWHAADTSPPHLPMDDHQGPHKWEIAVTSFKGLCMAVTSRFQKHMGNRCPLCSLAKLQFTILAPVFTSCCKA